MGLEFLKDELRMSSEDVGTEGDGSRASNHWVGDNMLHRCVDSDWLGNWDIVDDLSDRDLWLDLSDLWSNVSMGSDWGQNVLLGDKGPEVSGLSRSNDCSWSVGDSNWSMGDSNWCWGSNRDCSSGLNDLSIVSDNRLCNSNRSWGRGYNNLLLFCNNHLGLGDKSRGGDMGDSWLDDAGGKASDNGFGLKVHGLCYWDLDMGDRWSSHSGEGNPSGKDPRVVQTLWGSQSHRGKEGQKNQ